MTKVFIGGSRHVSRLNVQMRQRLDTILSKGLPIIIGDANGADKAVQKYLFDKHYTNVKVYCSDRTCRNNVGGWTVHSVPVRSQKKTADFYSEKDRAMAEEATVGLMMWDGESVGTLMNVFRLLKLNKKAVVYAVPQRDFIEFHNTAQWEIFVDHCHSSLRRKLEERIVIERTAKAAAPLQTSFLDHGHRS
jgi:hypothetical protein